MSVKNRAFSDDYANNTREENTAAFNFGEGKSKEGLKTDRQDNGPINNIPGRNETTRRGIPKGRGNRSS